MEPYISTNIYPSKMKMIINSSEGTDMLPSSYIDNDFEGLFENEDSSNSINDDYVSLSTCAPTSTSKSQSLSSSTQLPYGQQHCNNQQHKWINQQKLNLMRQCQRENDSKEIEMKKRQSLLIQKHLDKALLCLQQANANNRLGANKILQYVQKQHPRFVNDIFQQTDFPSGVSSCSDSILVPKKVFSQKEGDIVTTPLLSQLYPPSSDTTEASDNYGSQQLKEDITSPLPCERPSVAEVLTPNSLTKHTRTKKRSYSEDSSCSSRSTASNSESINNPQSKIPKMSSSHRYVKVIASKLPRIQEKNDLDLGTSPAATYMRILRSRSYDISTFESLSKYFSTPSKLQKASFGNAVIKTVHERDCKTLKRLLSCGLSPNPCNQFGDSILNTVCKRGHEELFETLIDSGASVSTSDHFGRTPLHFVCWSSSVCFSTVEKILSLDVDMLRATDKVGKTSLDYISFDKWDEWNKFLIENQENFWPINKKNHAFCSSTNYDTMKSLSLPDPNNALAEDIAKVISSGTVGLGNIMGIRASS